MGLTYPGVQFLELSGEQFRSTVPAELYSAGIVLNPLRHRDKISIPIAQVTSIRHVNLQAPEKKHDRPTTGLLHSTILNL